MSSIVAGPPEVEIDYPEGPRSVPEGELHWDRRTELALALKHWYQRRGVADAWVSCDINIYYREGDPRVVVAPDIAVAHGIDPSELKAKSSYKVWKAGAPPCFVLEVTSPRSRHRDVHVKPACFAALGAREYWRFDPTGGDLLDPPLQGERRRSGRWTPIRVAPDGGGLRGRSEVLGLDLCWRPPKLRLWDVAAGAWLPDPDDQIARADAEAAARRAAEAELAELRARLGDSP